MESRRLSFSYGAKQALWDISLKIPEKTVTAFIGPSGCGKSTYLRCLNRMNDIIPDTVVEGEVLLDGRDVYGPGTDVVDLRRRVGMVFQKSNPFPKSISDNVAYGLRINGLCSRRRSRTVSRRPCAAPRSGRRSRTAWTPPRWASPAASSSDSASPAPSRSSPKCS